MGWREREKGKENEQKKGERMKGRQRLEAKQLDDAGCVLLCTFTHLLTSQYQSSVLTERFLLIDHLEIIGTVDWTLNTNN